MKSMHKHFARLIMLLVVLALVAQLAPAVSAAGREEQLNQKIQQIVASIPSSAKTAAEKSLYLHDYIVKNVAYEMVGEHQTAYGALLDGKAVCAGYADAYKRLLEAVGIEARTITGHAAKANGELESHAWTMLMIDGKCLFTDVTWDDPFINGQQDPNYVGHDYFHITLEQMNKDHFPDQASQKFLPSKCNHTGYDYYSIHQGEGTGYGIFSPSTTAAEAAKYFKYIGVVDGSDFFECEFRYDYDNVNNWIDTNWTSIASNLGLSGSLGLWCQIGGTTVTMRISGTLDKTVHVTGVSLSESKITLTTAGETFQLTATVNPGNATNKAVKFESSNRSVATVTGDGLVTAVANGTATITVTTVDGNKTAKCTVTVSIAAPPAPTDPTDPTTQPTQPATQPTTQPTQPSTQPTQPTQSTQPTVPGATLPTNPTQPTSPADPDNTTDPTEPTEPTDPMEPVDPTDPADVTEPLDPVDPDNPTVSTDPVEQTQPDATTDGNDPDEPEATNGSVKPEDTTPSVSDTQTTHPQQSTQKEDEPKSNNTAVIVIALGGGLCVAGVLIYILRKRKV